MRYRLVRFDVLVGTMFGLAVAWAGHGAGGAAESEPLPTFADVTETVRRHFETMPDYQPGDIIARSQVEPLFTQLKRMGWTVADRKSILNNVPADNAYLVRQLRTRPGRKVMRRIAKYPHAYDRLDRLSRLPHGKQTVHDLIHKVGGHEMIKYLTTAPGGIKMGKMLSKAPKGRDFNKPTGRIYTVKMLLARLNQSYAAARKGAVAHGK